MEDTNIVATATPADANVPTNPAPERKRRTANPDKPKKDAAPKKARSFEELEDIAPTKMTDAERIAYIKDLRATVNLYRNKFHEMQKNSESSFKLSRRNQAVAQHLLNAQNKDFDQILDTVEHAMVSISMLAKIRKTESEELINGD